ncbi:MAG: epimerase [Bacteroidetes bacterium]|nr:MAG: epimerase [Bacteroidota bacterium]
MLQVIITGTTGMVGKGVLLECLDSPDVDKVLIVNRSTIGLEHPKLKEVLVNDFMDLTSIEAELAGYNACYFCLGVSAAGMSEENYTKLTYDLTLYFATTLLDLNSDMCFCYVSGVGTDTTETSSMMWARVKGKTENAILDLGFKDAYAFRPGMIEPKRGVRGKAAVANFFYAIMTPLFPLINLIPGALTDSAKIGQAMLNVTLSGSEKKHLGAADINKLAR